MRCHYLLGQEDEAANFAARVMYDPGTRMTSNGPPNFGTRASHATRASTARSWRTGGMTFGGSAGAETQYLLAEHDHNAGAFDACEEKLFGLIEQFYNHDAWKNKGSCCW